MLKRLALLSLLFAPKALGYTSYDSSKPSTSVGLYARYWNSQASSSGLYSESLNSKQNYMVPYITYAFFEKVHVGLSLELDSQTRIVKDTADTVSVSDSQIRTTQALIPFVRFYFNKIWFLELGEGLIKGLSRETRHVDLSGLHAEDLPTREENFNGTVTNAGLGAQVELFKNLNFLLMAHYKTIVARGSVTTYPLKKPMTEQSSLNLFSTDILVGLGYNLD